MLTLENQAAAGEAQLIQMNQNFMILRARYTNHRVRKC